MKDLPKAMRTPRKPRRLTGFGDAWYYVGRKGLEVVTYNSASISPVQFRISTAQIRRALQIIKTDAE